MNESELGKCARCDQPATVAITDGPGNVRCDRHAAAIFQLFEPGSMTRMFTSEESKELDVHFAAIEALYARIGLMVNLMTYKRIDPIADHASTS